MHRWDPSRIGITALALLSVSLLAIVGLALRDRGKKHELVLAAGSSEGESYLLGLALKQVVEKHNPKIHITVKETGGTSENLRMMADTKAQLATAQADVPVQPMTRMVAVLYEDIFQLLVRPESKVDRFPELSGLRIALPQQGGQYQSFLRLAEHFGLDAADFHFVGGSDHDAEAKFLSGDADVLFRVRALGNPNLTRLVRARKARFIGLEQASAMRIKYPAFEPSTIPQGAYLGNPAIPDRDLPSVAVKRTLLAHRDVPAEVVHDITATLMERRQELADAIDPKYGELRPLLASVRPPETQTGLGAAIHEGAKDYYDKDKPSFVQEHADYFSLLVTLVLLGGSWLWELKRAIERRQKNQADEYSNRVVEIMNHARQTSDPVDLKAMREKLLDLLTEAVRDLDNDKVSEDSFQSFRAVLQIALDVVEDRERLQLKAMGAS